MSVTVASDYKSASTPERLSALVEEVLAEAKRLGASAAGYLFNRIYPNWTEARGGGR